MASKDFDWPFVRLDTTTVARHAHRAKPSWLAIALFQQWCVGASAVVCLGGH